MKTSEELTAAWYEAEHADTTPIDELVAAVDRGAHARGFESGYAAAIHDARIPGSTAHHELCPICGGTDDHNLACPTRWYRDDDPATGSPRARYRREQAS